MKRVRSFMLIMLMVLFCFVPGLRASAAGYDGKWADANGNGIIELNETGELVVMLQYRLRELDYFFFKPTGRYQGMTRNAIVSFQKNQMDDSGGQFISDGTVGEQSQARLLSSKAVRANIAEDIHIPVGANATGAQTQKGTQTGWETVKGMLQTGTAYAIIDFYTGTTFNMLYTGGRNHAEMECAGAQDATTYKQAFGGEFTYFKRPMLIRVGDEFIACSLQGQPHGEDTISRNDMDGHACLFFQDSKSHVGELSDVEHVNNVYTAAGQSQ